MKKIFVAAAAALLFACGKTDAADVVMYTMPTCPHCINAKKFAEAELKAHKVEIVDVTKNNNNQKRFTDAIKKCGLSSYGVPLIIVRGECLQGYGPGTDGKIKDILNKPSADK